MPGIQPPSDLTTLLATALGGIIAVTSSFVVQRKQHQWNSRDIHHQELVREIIHPWAREVDRQRNFVDRLETYVQGSRKMDGSFVAREPYFGGTLPQFPHNSPLFDASLAHWKLQHELWQGQMFQLKQLDKTVISELHALCEAFPPKPPHREWLNHQDQYPRAAPANIAVNIWEQYWQWKRLGMTSQFETWLIKHFTPYGAAGTPDENEAFARPVLQHLRSRDANLSEIGRTSATRSEELQWFRKNLLSKNHDRNFSGKCDYCPKFFPRP